VRIRFENIRYIDKTAGRICAEEFAEGGGAGNIKLRSKENGKKLSVYDFIKLCRLYTTKK
jgi:hypothetical protein